MGPLLTASGETCRVTQHVQRTPLSGLLLGCLLLFEAKFDALLLDDCLQAVNISRAWLVWSGAAESVLADTCWFAGGPVPERGLILGRGCARFRIVRLGGPEVREVCSNEADALGAGNVFMYRDLSVALCASRQA